MSTLDLSAPYDAPSAIAALALESANLRSRGNDLISKADALDAHIEALNVAPTLPTNAVVAAIEAARAVAAAVTGEASNA